jgi:hypothetical protein
MSSLLGGQRITSFDAFSPRRLADNSYVFPFRRLATNFAAFGLDDSSTLHIRWLSATDYSLRLTASSTLTLAESEPESYVTTNGQSASLSWNKGPIWGLRPDFYYRRTVASLLIWGALSDERTGLSFTIAAGSSQRSHSRVRAPWDSRPYFTVSDLRLPFSSPPTTRRVTVELFDPAFTRVSPP